MSREGKEKSVEEMRSSYDMHVHSVHGSLLDVPWLKPKVI